VRISGSCDVRHCHGLVGIAGYVVVRIRALARPAGEGGDTEARTDLAVLEGAGQYVRAREKVRWLHARHTAPGVQFRVDVVYGDGCRMPW
jgi:hypothetical protein